MSYDNEELSFPNIHRDTLLTTDRPLTTKDKFKGDRFQPPV